MSYEYDVALSFAGEDRKFVEDCAEILRSLKINVFYDNYEKEILLGKNLYSYLGFMMELFRQNLIERAFVLPAIVPN